MELQDLSPDTVVGRLGSNIAGPAQAITFAALANAIGVNSNANIFNVLNYGATGNGVADDTSAINNAIAAFNTAGAGILYFPSGNYLVPGGVLTTMTGGGTVRGDGMQVTKITSTSSTGVLLTFSSNNFFQLENLDLVNTSGTTPVSGCSAIVQKSTGGTAIFNMSHLEIIGFYDNIDLQGMQGLILDVNSGDAVNYCMRMRNTVNADLGSWHMLGGKFYASVRTPAAGLRWESNGAGSLDNVIVSSPAAGPSILIGIDIDHSNATEDVWLDNISCEGASKYAIRIQNTSRVFLSNIEIFGDVLDGTNSAAIDIAGVTGCSVTNLVAQRSNSPFINFVNFNSSTTKLVIGPMASENAAKIDGLAGVSSTQNLTGLTIPITGFTDVVSLLAIGTNIGCRYMVNNTSQASPTLGQAVVSGDAGGTNIRPVFADGSSWRYG